MVKPIDIDKLYFEQAGDGEHLILGHAGFVDSRMWQAQWLPFTQSYKTLRYDMLGNGQSEAATEPIARRYELLGLVEHLNIERGHFVGSSLSGATFLDFALEFPEKVQSLILLNAVPNGFEMQGDPPPHMMDMLGAWQAGQFEEASKLQLRVWLDGIYRDATEVDRELRQQVAEMNIIAVQNRTMFIADFQPANPLEPQAITRLQEIKCPVLIVDSTLDHPEISRAAAVMIDAIPNAQRVTIEGAAHLPNMEKPDEFSQAVLDFLNSVSK